MVVQEGRFRGLPSLTAWWPYESADVWPLLRAAPIVLVRQCSEPVADAVAAHAFQRKRTPTALIDLTRPEGELLADMSRTCRKHIRLGEGIGCRVAVNEDWDGARRLIDEHIRRAGYQRTVSSRRWRQLEKTCDAFTVQVGGDVLGAHLLASDGSRVRSILLGTAPRGTRDEDRRVGYANRYLRWQEFLHYQGQGARTLDMGGVVLDPESPLYSISQFKLSFGGAVVDEWTVYLARSSALRAGLRIAGQARLAVVRARAAGGAQRAAAAGDAAGRR